MVTLKYLVNSFGSSYNQKKETYKISVYSDYLDNIFTCGEYELAELDIINFNDLRIPCKEELVVNFIKKSGKDMLIT